MNDPHVVHLEYRIACKDHIDWSDAAEAVFEDDDFSVEIRDQRVLFKFKIHYGSEAAIEPYRQNWEIATGLERGLDAFSLRFARSEIVDPNTMIGFGGAITTEISFGPVKLILTPAQYPEPPAKDSMK